MKTVPAALQTHLDTQQTTLCFLLKIDPQNASAFGVTSLDVPVDFDDGGGSITYSAAIGMNQSAAETGAGLEVANSEAMLLITTDFTREDIAAGVLDYADFYLYRINYKSTSDGFYIIQSGRTGIVRSDDVLSGVLELRGLQQQLKQNYIDQYSLTCRATFGSTDEGAPFACNFDAEALFQANEVLSVGSETDREFTAVDTPAATGPNGALPFDFAIIEFLTGNNAGLTVETETVVGDDITLRFNSAYAI